ncbi:hypothetical protein TK45_15580 [Bowmanella sp. JS7-9]|nr:hypothetical protein TK45_15580 [Bowmanella sp. JS7-9]
MHFYAKNVAFHCAELPTQLIRINDCDPLFVTGKPKSLFYTVSKQMILLTFWQHRINPQAQYLRGVGDFNPV